MKHTKQDIQNIITEYVGGPTEKIKSRPSLQTYKESAKMVATGERKLKRLRLSAADRRHLSVLREAMSELRQALEAGAQANEIKHKRKMNNAVRLANEYTRRTDGK
ncbi:hypothetical protein M948_19400 [Virgibacillus sp. CM-4]|uniref:hypothetical protein n=1 Tax=Virgibacillus sp. CM-4 TaxID=1354277 RepID=UPI00038870C7|nr:hypothetical protein [Virgibacillus sp. CM-4]EQB35267.1 hypothetical protein M948_19400 [Virgibacillus sp. CM-4]